MRAEECRICWREAHDSRRQDGKCLWVLPDCWCDMTMMEWAMWKALKDQHSITHIHARSRVRAVDWKRFLLLNFPVTFHAIYTQLHSWFMVVMGILISQFYVQHRLINSKPWKFCVYFVKIRWKVNGKITRHAEWIKLCLRYISSCRRNYSLSTPSARSEKKFNYYPLHIHTFQWCETPLLTKITTSILKYFIF